MIQLLFGVPVLAMKQDITVVTDSIPVAYETALMDIQTILCEGPVKNESLRINGHRVTEIIDTMDFDFVFLSTDGMDIPNGFTIYSYDEIEIKKRVMTRFKKSVVVMDRSKLYKRARIHFVICRMWIF
ncbi:MAG: hypothetical protein PUF70_00670 [Absicoccus porci]|uniref:hypothetical protein n=1 Tax=Absicoccus porci TaxID=2486576 RepID=UPI00240A6AAE|nr:hypothetical protein [Absicoccus porci]MDD6459186.1 hypothetical protein [Absicoccus porci]